MSKLYRWVKGVLVPTTYGQCAFDKTPEEQAPVIAVFPLVHRALLPGPATLPDIYARMRCWMTAGQVDAKAGHVAIAMTRLKRQGCVEEIDPPAEGGPELPHWSAPEGKARILFEIGHVLHEVVTDAESVRAVSSALARGGAVNMNVMDDKGDPRSPFDFPE